jgi:hypothetical protein
MLEIQIFKIMIIIKPGNRRDLIIRENKSS